MREASDCSVFIWPLQQPAGLLPGLLQRFWHAQTRGLSLTDTE